MRIDSSSQQAMVLQRAHERGESCPSCESSDELKTDGSYLPYADGGIDVWLWCSNDPHPFPYTDPAWYFALSSEELQRMGIRTGL